MKHPIEISFEHDSDSNLYLLSADPGANQWEVIVHCRDGKTHQPKIEKFYAYPGRARHEGEAAWLVDYLRPEKIEVRRPGHGTVMLRHPDLPEQWQEGE